MVPKMALIRGNGGLDVRFYVRDPKKAHPWAEPHVLAYFVWCIDLRAKRELHLSVDSIPIVFWVFVDKRLFRTFVFFLITRSLHSNYTCKRVLCEMQNYERVFCATLCETAASYKASNLQCVSKNVPTVASCIFDKHGLILIILCWHAILI